MLHNAGELTVVGSDMTPEQQARINIDKLLEQAGWAVQDVGAVNLGRQTLREFQGFTTPDEGRKFTELCNVQLLQSGRIDPVSRVCISTIQRVYSILKSEDLAPDPDLLSSLGSRLARLDCHLTPKDRETIETASHGTPLQSLISDLVNAADPDAALDAARQATGQDDPPESAVTEARQRLLEGAALPFAENPDLRQRLVDIFGKTSP